MLILNPPQKIKDFLKNHLGVILIFTIFTIILTYPVFFSPEKIPGTGYRDLMTRVWEMWWFNFALHDSDLSIFSTQYLRYPTTLFMTSLSPFLALASVPLQSIFSLLDSYKILFFSSFIFTGYTTFLLSRYLTKNYIAAILAGFIFSFNVFHFHHAKAHLGLVTLFWIPLFVLYLLKTNESKKIKYPIISGILLFLVFLSQWYLFYFTLLLISIFILYYLIKRTKKSFWIRFLILISILLILSSPFLALSIIPNFESGAATGRSQDEIVKLSADLLSYFIPSRENLVLKDIGDIFDLNFPSARNSNYLGFTTLFFVFLAIIRKSHKDIILWSAIAFIFLLISLGPYLKINNIITNIPLPYLLLSEFPFFSMFRAIERASILAFFGFSILASFGFAYLLTKLKDRKFLKIVVIFITFTFIFIEFLF